LGSSTLSRSSSAAYWSIHASGISSTHVCVRYASPARGRVRSAQAVRGQVADADVPVVFTADVNAAAGASAPYDVLVADGGLLDTWEDADERLTPYVGTFPNYGTPDPDGTRIDWVLATPGVQVLAATINTWTHEGRWPSDHTPVQALLRLT
jgi:endonuclease/exonuclease/phosphatase family metal-dependent hydrolase